MATARMIFFGEAALLWTRSTYAEHYRQERNHRGMGNQILDRGEELGRQHGPIDCRQRMGGLLRDYHGRTA